MTVIGHSGFKKTGKDIVCAAVSILVQTAYLTISSVPGTVYTVTDSTEYLLELAGYGNLYSGELKGITFFLISGLEAVYEKYNKYVKLTIKGDNYGSS